MKHEYPIKVFYEDTDLAGIVYYANYLKFIERGRSTMVWEAGVDQSAMKAAGIVFVVRHIDADFLAAAKFQDDVVVTTEIEPFKGVKLVFNQAVRREDTVLFKARVTVACMSLDGRPVRLPLSIRDKLQQFAT
ncbi:MAG: tol-pal system-associated acyl-CoA thioesterase [Pseudomonadota bacterium]